MGAHQTPRALFGEIRYSFCQRLRPLRSLKLFEGNILLGYKVKLILGIVYPCTKFYRNPWTKAWRGYGLCDWWYVVYRTEIFINKRMVCFFPFCWLKSIGLWIYLSKCKTSLSSTTHWHIDIQLVTLLAASHQTPRASFRAIRCNVATSVVPLIVNTASFWYRLGPCESQKLSNGHILAPKSVLCPGHDLPLSLVSSKSVQWLRREEGVCGRVNFASDLWIWKIF